VDLFIEAFNLYSLGKLIEARAKFESYLEKYPLDRTAKKHLRTCIKYEGREQDWQRFNVMTKK
jgi:hypothetical protein